MAIKELKQHNLDGYVLDSDWKREAEALRVFNNELNDPHIVRGVGAFTQKFTYYTKYYLVMEWANGGSLKDAWERDKRPEMNCSRIMELLIQFRGLAGALRRMHNAVLHEETPTHALISIKEPDGSKDERHYRHGDIKPDNILRFMDSSSWLGTLKLADLGRARFHDRDTRNRTVGTGERFGHWRYEPPEIWTDQSAAWSRRYDIWSFGCVLFESVIWLLYGSSALKQFESLYDQGQGSPYWTWESTRRTARINENALALMSDILANDPECQSRSAIRDLVVLVRDKLLVIVQRGPLAIARDRVYSDSLYSELDKIVSEAQRDSAYLFTGSPRTSVTPPEILVRRNMRRESQQSSYSHQSDPQSPTTIACTLDQCSETSGYSSSASDASESLMSSSRGSKLHPRSIKLRPGNLVTRRTSSPHYGRPMDSYRHDFEDTWEFEDDNVFARRIICSPAFNAEGSFNGEESFNVKESLPTKKPSLCERCARLDFRAPKFKIRDTAGGLRDTALKGCEFCSMRLQVVERVRPGKSIVFDRFSSGLRLNKSTLPVMSLCRPSGAYSAVIDPQC